MIKVAILNETSFLSDADITPVVAALQIQVSRDFYPRYGIDASLVQIPKGQPRPVGAGMWWLALMNTSDFAGALGYHDVTPEGLPLGKAFVKSDFDSGRPWSATVSHELLEMLADPDISTVIEYAGTKKTIFFAREVCDPCQADEFGYRINGILVSDFVLPGWFHKYRNYKTFDHAGHITKAFQILKGGYISVYDPTTGLGWQDINAKTEPPTDYNARARVGSRRERRRLSREQWVPSRKEA